MFTRILATSALSIVLSTTCTLASTLDINFSFSDDNGDFFGRIVGLEDNISTDEISGHNFEFQSTPFGSFSGDTGSSGGGYFAENGEIRAVSYLYSVSADVLGEGVPVFGSNELIIDVSKPLDGDFTISYRSAYAYASNEDFENSENLVSVSGGGIVEIYVNPLPAGGLLLLSGIVGVVALKRRKEQAA